VGKVWRYRVKVHRQAQQQQQQQALRSSPMCTNQVGHRTTFGRIAFLTHCQLSRLNKLVTRL